MSQPIGPEVYTVARLNREVRALLQSGLPALWVEGEVSRVARPASGHVYFELKDPAARVRCVLWRARATLYGRMLVEGAQVLLRVRATLYEDRGEYQLDVEHAEPAGEGRLKLAFEALKLRLASEGLFDAARKRPLPARIRSVGLITSPTGAAIHDVLTTLARRAPWLEVIVYPTSVQGASATAELVAALGHATARAECDVLLLVRGGGSLEDLWSFNEEAVARAIRACSVPVVSGVGHEIDVTIADLAADVRAPTPTAAAELVAPDGQALLQRASGLARRLRDGLRRALALHAERLAQLVRRLSLGDPRLRLRQRMQRLDELEVRLLRALSGGLTRRQQRLAAVSRTLQAVSPLATLARGYAIVTDAAGRVVDDAAGVSPGDTLRARLTRGQLQLAVIATEEDPG